MTRARQGTQFGLAGASVLLAALLVYEISAPLPEFDPPAFRLRPRAQRAAGIVAVTTPPPDAFAAIDARPPFSPSRRPIAVPGTGGASLAPPELSLVGVILDKEESLALLKTPTSPLATAYRVGAMISGWQLSEISPDRIVLSAGAARSEIRLDSNKTTPRPPTPVPLNSQ